jgi:hypothetical protein
MVRFDSLLNCSRPFSTDARSYCPLVFPRWPRTATYADGGWAATPPAWDRTSLWTKTWVTGEHRRRKAVLGTIRETQRVFLIGGAEDRRDGPENFLACQNGILWHRADRCRAGDGDARRKVCSRTTWRRCCASWTAIYAVRAASVRLRRSGCRDGTR